MNYEKDIYIIMESNFLKENKRTIKEDNSDLFPHNWYLCIDYVLKAQILMEAIKNKTSIVNTSLYKKNIVSFKNI